VVNIGSDIEISILEFARFIIQFLDSNSKILHVDELKEGDMKRRMPDNSRMKKLLGRELLPLEEGIKKVLDQTKYILE